jgi:hypothetical protein
MLTVDGDLESAVFLVCTLRHSGSGPKQSNAGTNSAITAMWCSRNFTKGVDPSLLTTLTSTPFSIKSFATATTGVMHSRPAITQCNKLSPFS